MRGLNKKITMIKVKETKFGKEWLSMGSIALLLLWVTSLATTVSATAFGTLIFIQIKSGGAVHQDIATPIMISMFISYIALLLVVSLRGVMQLDKFDA
ncbi:MAG: hypothetical protein VYA60_04870 [Pseudomonadota bacterium]|nr:hypothetical protein [Pseudomonadota bacterium]